MARKLTTYQDKRDFEVTSEPSGSEDVLPSQRLRFIIQKHAATRLHYDLRLEYEGVFLSWAVTRGPALDPKERRLAVEVEDHPLAYGDFEGAIPKGEYGGGTVMLWDRGYWAPEPGKTIEQQLQKGHLTAVFEGERMNGAWHLVRLNSDREKSKRTNWLLIKAHDGREKEGDDDAFLKSTDFSIASGRRMEDIAAGKGKAPTPFMTGVKLGADAVWNSDRDPEASGEVAAAKADAPVAPPEDTPSAKPASKAASKPKAKRPAKSATAAAPLPDFIAPQLSKLLDRPPAGQGWAHEIKFDGYRLQLRVENGAAQLRTRKGLDWTAKFREIAEDGAGLADGIYDGEAVALDAEGRPDFAGLQDAISTGKTAGLVLYVFDALFEGGEDIRALPLSDRKARLQAAVSAAPASPRIRYVDHFITAGDAVLQSACRMDLEGIISKKLDAPYQSGRSETWTKAKCRGGQEVVLAGWNTNEGDIFRSLIAGVYRDGRLVHVGNIGTGYSRSTVEALMPRLKAAQTDTSPFDAGGPRKSAKIHWLKPVLVAEIQFAGWTGDGHIRQASFKGLREDKPATEVAPEGRAAEQGVDAEIAAEATPAPKPKAASETSQPPPAPKSTVSAKGSSLILGQTISNPDKPLWPAHDGQPAVTKIEHARYLEAVCDWMMPHIKGRPCSLIRLPDGIEGKQRFFQRHVGKGTSALFTSVEVSGDREPYIQIDRPEALLAGAQSGALEFHPWNCQPGAPETPGRLVFDLDPAEDLDFARVIEGAKEVKARLEALGLTAFCKNTGGKGLHVVTPLAPSNVDWPTAKAFAREVCERMEADSPDRYLVNMAKAKRVGKIFLDYLRNDRMSTAVSPLSARARPGAPVSFPLNWSQVKVGLDPHKYTIRTVPKLLAATKAWQEYCDSEGDLPAAMEALAKQSPRRVA